MHPSLTGRALPTVLQIAPFPLLLYHYCTTTVLLPHSYDATTVLLLGLGSPKLKKGPSLNQHHPLTDELPHLPKMLHVLLFCVTLLL